MYSSSKNFVSIIVGDTNSVEFEPLSEQYLSKSTVLGLNQ